jgi:hypothetical protein
VAELLRPGKLDLESVRAKIDWAEKHAQTVKDKVRPWMDSRPYRVTQKRNVECTRHSLIARLQGPEPPLREWTLIVGDCIYNLRCALDHLVYAIAVHESGQEPPLKGDDLMFPIADSPERFAKAVWRISSLSDPVRAAIEGVQPYHRPQIILPPLLSVLRELNNADKHKLLRLAFNAVIQGDLGFAGTLSTATGAVQFIPNYGEIKDGTEIAAIAFDRPQPDMKYDRIELCMIVAIGHAKRDPTGPAGSDRTDFSALLSLLIAEVKAVVNLIVADT